MGEKALIVIDIQNDFCPAGALAVNGGDEIIPAVNHLINEFEHVILTQDWHPAGHSSFSSSHPGMNPFDIVQVSYGAQTLWPDHCLQGTKGAEFHPALEWTKAELIVRKGFRKSIDSYSAFYENDRITPTGLGGYLKERAISDLTIVGLATDFCVSYSAIDARKLGFAVTVRLDSCRAIDLDGSFVRMQNEMISAGVTLL
jgi:nicotinamidase/pyrazinamidase